MCFLFRFLSIETLEFRAFPDLHLGSLVLEPELHLEGLQAELPAEFLPLLVIGMGALLEEAEVEKREKQRSVQRVQATNRREQEGDGDLREV